MRHCRPSTALLIVLATTVSLAQSVAPIRDVQLALTLPNNATPVLRVAEGGTGTVELPGVGTFGFVPRIQDGNVVVVDVFDMNATPHKRLARLETIVGGDPVRSKTKPDFGVRAIQIIS